MKKFLVALIVVIMLVAAFGITTASAGASISGSSVVVAGKSYTYKGTASYSAGDIVCKIEGLGQVASGFDGATGLVNQSLTATASIKVKIPSSAQIGDTFSITFSGQYSDMNPDGSGSSTAKSFSTTKTITVGVPPTRDPNAPLVGWEIVEAAIEDAAPNAPILVELGTKYEDISKSLLEMIIDNKSILTIDYGTYKVTIDPAKLKDISGVKSVDLSLAFEKAEELSEAAGGKDIYQLHFGNSGEFPGLISFTFKAEENSPGDKVYLYYYYGEAGVLEGVAEAVVDENGMVTFEIYHCSSYFVTQEVLPDAAINFDTQSAETIESLSTSLDEVQTTNQELQSQLDDSQAEVTQLIEELAAVQAELEAEPEEADSSDEMTAEGSGASVSLLVFIISVIAAIILGAIISIVLFKAGWFKKQGAKAS